MYGFPLMSEETVVSSISATAVNVATATRVNCSQFRNLNFKQPITHSSLRPSSPSLLAEQHSSNFAALNQLKATQTLMDVIRFMFKTLNLTWAQLVQHIHTEVLQSYGTPSQCIKSCTDNIKMSQFTENCKEKKHNQKINKIFFFILKCHKKMFKSHSSFFF